MGDLLGSPCVASHFAIFFVTQGRADDFIFTADFFLHRTVPLVRGPADVAGTGPRGRDASTVSTRPGIRGP